MYANKMESLEEIDKLLETYKPKSESIHNMNRLITRNETESVIKSLPTNKSPGAVSFTREFYQTFREELTPILLKLIQKNWRGRNASELILQDQHHPDTKTRPDKDTPYTKNYRAISLINTAAKMFNKILTNQNQQYIKRVIYPRDTRMLQYLQINQCDTPH